MPNLAAWLLAIAWPVVKKVMLMLGIGVITYGGLTTLTDAVIQHAVSNWGQMTGSALQICSLGGIPEMLGIVCGALTSRAGLVALGRIGRLSS